MFTNTPNMKDDYFSGTFRKRGNEVFYLDWNNVKVKEGLFSTKAEMLTSLLFQKRYLKTQLSIDVNKDFNTRIIYINNRNLT